MAKVARRAAKRDTAEPEIVRALEHAGATVYRVDQPLDLIIGFRGKTYLAEVKTGKAKLRDSQVRFIETWRGSRPEILRSVDDAIEWIQRRATYSEDDLTRHHFGDS